MTFAYLLTPNHDAQNVDLQTVQFHGDGSDIVESIQELLGTQNIDVAYGRNKLDKHIIYSDHEASVEDGPGFIFIEDISNVAIPGRLVVMGVWQSGDSAVSTDPTITVGEMKDLCHTAYGNLKVAQAVVSYLDNMVNRYK